MNKEQQRLEHFVPEYWNCGDMLTAEYRQQYESEKLSEEHRSTQKHNVQIYIRESVFML